MISPEPYRISAAIKIDMKSKGPSLDPWGTPYVNLRETYQGKLFLVSKVAVKLTTAVSRKYQSIQVYVEECYG